MEADNALPAARGAVDNVLRNMVMNRKVEMLYVIRIE